MYCLNNSFLVEKDCGRTRVYDGNNKMISAYDAGVPTSYRYNADGQRTIKTMGTVSTWYIYGMSGELIAEYPANGATNMPQMEYGYRGGELLIEGGCDVVRWKVSDHLGSTRMSVGTPGTLASVKRTDYLPFGEEIGATVGIRTAAQGYSQVDCWKQKFTGKERDTETGLDYLGARYYTNIQGRFTSIDPLPVTRENFVNPQRWNQYTYSLNSPTNLIDPNGADGEGQAAGKVITVFLLVAATDRDSGKPVPNWEATKKIAEKNGYTFNIVTPKDGTPEQISASFRDALQSSEVVVIVQHGTAGTPNGSRIFEQTQIKVGEESYSNDGVYKNSETILDPGGGYARTVLTSQALVSDQKPDATASVIGNFSCSAYGNTANYFNFTGNNQRVVEAVSGADGFTSVGTLEAASNAFITTYVQSTGDKTSAGVNSANRAVNQRRDVKHDGKKLNNNGDRIESTVVND